MSAAFSRSRVAIDPCAKRAALPIEGGINPAGLQPMAFTLAHLSDPHLPPLPAARLRDLASKRALGYLNWTRNRHKYHRREVLDALVADIRAQAPDHIAVTGDLVNLALEAEAADGFPSASLADQAARRRAGAAWP